MFSVTTSLNIEFNEFNGNVICTWWVISADSQFNVISCGTGQVLCKPWRVVELTACAGGCTVLTIPENIIRVEYELMIPGRVKTTLTKIIISNKCRNTIVIMCVSISWTWISHHSQWPGTND